jgi:radical SAM protein with 4Fe4S-binding SPASM domain
VSPVSPTVKKAKAPFRPPLSLSLLSISITERCNLACRHCGGLQFRDKSRLGVSSELSRKELRALFHDARALGCRSVIISGGEPLLRPDVWKIFHDAEDAGLSFSVFTNGTMLTKDALHRLRDYRKLDQVRISLDYINSKDFERLRGIKHGPALVLEKIEALSASGIRVGVGMVLFEDNLKQIGPLARALQKRGAWYLRSVPFLPIGNAAGRLTTDYFLIKCIAAVLSARKTFDKRLLGAVTVSDRLGDEFEKLLVVCGGGKDAASISAHGHVSFCPGIDAKAGAPSLREKPLTELVTIASKDKDAWQRAIRRQSPACRSCVSYSFCRGGCITEWDSRRDKNARRRTLCFKTLWPAVVNNIIVDSAMRRVIANTLFQIKMNEIFLGKRFFCYRELPIWVTRLR